MPDLTTLANVKDYMQIADGSADSTLARLITSFSAWFLNQINRGSLLTASYTEKRNGQGGDSITTKQYPITAVTSVTIGGVSIPASDGTISGFVFDDMSIFLIGYLFCKGHGNVQLAYTAGYAAIPGDIEQAVIDQVVFTHRRQRNLGTTAQTMQGTLTTSFSQRDLAPGVGPVLANYKSNTAVGI